MALKEAEKGKERPAIGEAPKIDTTYAGTEVKYWKLAGLPELPGESAIRTEAPGVVLPRYSESSHPTSYRATKTTTARSDSSKEKECSKLEQVSCYNKRSLLEVPLTPIGMFEYLLWWSSR